MYTCLTPFVIFLTGLSASGKTTIANALYGKLKWQGIEATILDGDEIREAGKNSAFDEVSRKAHNLYVGRMAAELENQGECVIVALIAPYQDIRNEIRKMCKNFKEVYVSTDINVCIQRDPKGLYARALKGQIENFTGVSAPYFKPENPELILDTATLQLNQCVDNIIHILS